jgi:hypothetical protein
MSMSAVRSLVSFFCLGLLLGPCSGARAQDDADLAGDKRLEQSITLRYLNQSLEDIAKGLTRTLQIPVVASMEIRDRKATIIVRNRSASDVMSGLAHCLMMAWRKEANGYRLILSNEGRRIEKEQLKFEFEKDRANLKAWVGRLSKYEALDDDDVQEMWRESSRRLRQESAGLSPTERKALKQKTEELSSPWIAIASALLREPRAIDNLLLGRSIFASTNPADRGLPLKLALMHSRYDNGKKVLPAEVLLSLSYSAVKGELVARYLSLYEGEPGMPMPPMIARVADVTEKIGPLEQAFAKLATDPGPESKRPLNEEGEFRNPGYRSSFVSLADHLSYLSDTSGSDIIADAFRQGVSVARPFVGATTGEYLTSLHSSKNPKEIRFRPVDFVWSKNQFLMVRHANFWKLQQTEVPERILGPVEERIAKQGYSTIEDFAQIAGQVTAVQREVFELSSVGLFHFSKYPLGQAFEQLRFWGSLSPRQREEAQSEAGLPLTGLSGARSQIGEAAISDMIWLSLQPAEVIHAYLRGRIDLSAHHLRIIFSESPPIQDTEFAPIEGNRVSQHWTTGTRFQFRFISPALTRPLSKLGWLDRAIKPAR